MRTIRFSQLNVADSEQYCRAFLGVPIFFLLLCCFHNGRTSFANVHLQFLAQFFFLLLDSILHSIRIGKIGQMHRNMLVMLSDLTQNAFDFLYI